MGSLRIGQDWATSLSLFTFMHWIRKWQHTPVFLPGESQGQGSLVGCRLWGRTELDTTDATCSSSSSSSSILVSYGCCNKTPKVAGLKQVYSLMVLEARNPEWFSLGWNQGISMNVHLPENLGGHSSPCLFQSPMAACTPWLVAPSSIFKAHYSTLCFHLL